MTINYVDEVYQVFNKQNDPFYLLKDVACILVPHLTKQVEDIRSLVELLHKEKSYTPFYHVKVGVEVNESIPAIAKLVDDPKVRVFDKPQSTAIYCDLFRIFRALDYDFPKLLEYISEYKVEGLAETTTIHTVLSTADSEDIEAFLLYLGDIAQVNHPANLTYGELKTSIDIVKPDWWDSKLSNEPVKGQLSVDHEIFINSCQHSAEMYEQLIALGQTPLQASVVLPRAEKRELLITADNKDWKYIVSYLKSKKDYNPEEE